MRTAWVAKCRKNVPPYDLLRVVLAGVLLVAAGLKGHQLATEPVLGTGILDSRWFLIGVVEFELFFGLWLLANLRPRWTRVAALLCFGLFAAVSLYKAVSGAASCGCFGRVEVNPWYTFTLDTAAVLALLRWQPSGITSTTLLPSQAFLLRATAVTLAWLCVGFPAAVAMGKYQPAILAEDGIILGNDNLVIIEPEKWTGKRFPLLPFIEDTPGQLKPGERPLRERLAEGNWIVVLYHHDCPECQKAMPKYEDMARRMAQDPTAPRVALIEVPPYGNANSLKLSSEAPCTYGGLSDEKEWFVETPVGLVLYGTASGVAEVASTEFNVHQATREKESARYRWEAATAATSSAIPGN